MHTVSKHICIALISIQQFEIKRNINQTKYFNFYEIFFPVLNFYPQCFCIPPIQVVSNHSLEIGIIINKY